MKGGQYGFGETSWAAGSWGVAPAMRDGGAGSSGCDMDPSHVTEAPLCGERSPPVLTDGARRRSEQHRAAQQDARGTKRCGASVSIEFGRHRGWPWHLVPDILAAPSPPGLRMTRTILPRLKSQAC